MNIELRTPNEIAREERHRAICDTYNALKTQHPDCKPYRLMSSLAKQFEMTVPGIKNILTSRGLYKLNRK